MIATGTEEFAKRGGDMNMNTSEHHFGSKVIAESRIFYSILSVRTIARHIVRPSNKRW
jgi:hypothetical protein